jgi:4-cresol dehydrogenase (hydroxylating)
MSVPGLAAALEEWTRLLGPGNVTTNPATLQAAATATFITAGRVLAVLEPATREDVQAIVRIANQYAVPLYPISSGKNWGYGSKAPVADGVLLDLHRLNRILDFDEELAYVTIEPGVTQRQLLEFLRERKSRLWMDATGASPDSSIIGNTMERGFGHTPMGDHCSHVCAFEVVLPDGECIDTGFARFPGARAGALGRWGVGPSLDGLFSQSNLGIVTRLSVALMPAPESFCAFFFSTSAEDGLGAVVDALRPLRLNGTLRSVMHIGNDYKVVTATTRFPWDTANEDRPLGEPAMERLRRELSVGRWNGSGALYGTVAQVREAKKQLRRALKGKVDRLQFVDDRLIAIMRRFANPFRIITRWDIRRTLTLLEPVYNLLKGVPTDSTLASTYWRKRTPPPADPDPDRDACGLLWCSPVAPNTGSDVLAVTRLAADVLLRHGFEPQMSVSLATERSLICVTTISFDRAVPGQDERAMTCYEELVKQLLARGYPPYRLNVASMHHVADAGAYGEVLRRLKSTLDPNGVVAPGRYEPVARDQRVPRTLTPAS